MVATGRLQFYLVRKYKKESMDDGTPSPDSNISKTPEPVPEEPIIEEPKKAPRKPRKPKEVKEVKEPKEPKAKQIVVKKTAASKPEEGSIKDYQLKDSIFFPMLLATKRQLDKEARTARISNLRIV
jgi:hypothetical protein